MSARVRAWMSARVPLDPARAGAVAREVLREPIPHHMKNWFYAIGATALLLFLFQAVTGILLTIYYVPSPDGAYQSVRHITEDVRMGFWVRGLHHWGSSLMVIALFLHMVRVFFTRAYRRPRELNWIVGAILLVLTLALSFTGYSLVYNQLSYWAATVGTNMIREVPLVGAPVLTLLRGGEGIGGQTLTRFYVLHIMLLPALLLLTIAVHILAVRLYGVAKLQGEDEPTYPFYPEHFYHTLVIGLFLLTVMSALTVIVPPGLGVPADPLVTPQHIKPEWYFFAIYSVLKLLPLRLGIYLLAAATLAAVFWPFLDELLERRWPGARRAYWLGSVTIVLFLFFTVYETISG